MSAYADLTGLGEGADRMLDILSRQFANLLVLRAAIETGSINKAAEQPTGGDAQYHPA
jgi:hypothetical protein